MSRLQIGDYVRVKERRWDKDDGTLLYREPPSVGIVARITESEGIVVHWLILSHPVTVYKARDYYFSRQMKESALTPISEEEAVLEALL